MPDTDLPRITPFKPGDLPVCWIATRTPEKSIQFSPASYDTAKCREQCFSYSGVVLEKDFDGPVPDYLTMHRLEGNVLPIHQKK
jgi:hypothetical protein